MFYTIYDTNFIGKVILYGDDNFLCGLEFYKEDFIQPQWIENKDKFNKVITELELYFKGKLQNFSIPLKIKGTKFQQQVYNALLQIPYGKTISYKELAKNAGNQKAYRAAGNANGKNRIAIIIPCHRVIASDGSIGGYGGGLFIKRKLLNLEGVCFV